MNEILRDISARLHEIEDKIETLEHEHARLAQLARLAEREAADADYGRKSLAIQLGGRDV